MIDSFFLNSETPNYSFIRPSGKPIFAERFKQMLFDDVVQEKAEITNMHLEELLSEI